MRTLLITLATLLAFAAAGAPAHASGRDVIDDCTDDEVLSKSYSQKEYKDALAKLPADADQYGNCRDIIARAQDGAATKGGTKSSGGGAGASGGGGSNSSSSGGQDATAPPPPATAKDQLAAASDADRAAVDEARSTPDDAAVAVTAAEVGRAPDAGALADLPTPLLVLLALLLAGALALGAMRIRRLVHARRA
jgi:hypothetical protein